MSNTVNRKRGGIEKATKEQKHEHWLAGKTNTELCSLFGYVEGTAANYEIDWMKAFDHPDVQHTFDKDMQNRRWIPRSIKRLGQDAKTVVYEVCGGAYGNLTKFYKAICSAVFSFDYDQDNHEYTDCVPTFIRWAKKHIGVLIDVLDLDGYGCMARFFESGILDKLSSHPLIFYTFPRASNYCKNSSAMDENLRVFGTKVLTPEIVYAGFSRLLAKRGLRIVQSECLDTGAVYRMAMMCERISASKNQDWVLRHMATPAEIRAKASLIRELNVIPIVYGFQYAVPVDVRIKKALEIVQSGKTHKDALELLFARASSLIQHYTGSTMAPRNQSSVDKAVKILSKLPKGSDWVKKLMDGIDMVINKHALLEVIDFGDTHQDDDEQPGAGRLAPV